MRTRNMSTGIAAIAALVASSLRAQEPSRLGLNLSVAAVQQAGVTYRVSRGFELRPAVIFGWERRFGPDAASSQSFATYGLALDALFGAAGRDAVRPYVGVGVTYLFLRSSNPSVTGHQVGGTAFLGVRARIVPRVHVYGEVGVNYQATRTPLTQWSDQVSLRTTPLGLLVYLR